MHLVNGKQNLAQHAVLASLWAIAFHGGSVTCSPALNYSHSFLFFSKDLTFYGSLPGFQSETITVQYGILLRINQCVHLSENEQGAVLLMKVEDIMLCLPVANL